jgi:hypothetical protein
MNSRASVTSGRKKAPFDLMLLHSKIRRFHVERVLEVSARSKVLKVEERRREGVREKME